MDLDYTGDVSEMKFSDFVIDYLTTQGIQTCFFVSGGAVLHLVDSAERNPSMRLVCSQHEQAAATSADALSRVSQSEIGFCLTTSGPGATNLLTGVCNSYFDSIPMLCITGQVASFRQRQSADLRQFGFQETDIVSIFKPVTKYAVKLNDPSDILFELSKAIYIATSNRPGPVLIDIPDDFQRKMIKPSEMRRFIPPKQNKRSTVKIASEISHVMELISSAKRPVVLLGAGINVGKVAPLARHFIEHLGLPTLLTWGAKDVLNDDHNLNFGGVGVCGSRVGNWLIESSDLLLVLGSRLSQQITGSKLEGFAPKAKKVLIDIDSQEFKKFMGTGLTIDYYIEANLVDFMSLVLAEGRPEKAIDNAWLDRFIHFRKQFSIWSENSKLDLDVNVYEFMEKLSNSLHALDIVITDAGGNLSWTLQALRITENQRLISAWNHSPMGYSLPAAVGAAVAAPDHRIICIIGDGGLMMSLSEIATAKRNNLNIKIIVINNLGHGIQKQTIETWLDSNYVGVDQESGLYFPDFEGIAKSFGIGYSQISTNSEISSSLMEKIWLDSSPCLIEVMIDKDQRISPMLKFGTGLSELNPVVSMPDLLN
jgi:acetolactate synthase-1/2/3 large subunit